MGGFPSEGACGLCSAAGPRKGALGLADPGSAGSDVSEAPAPN